MNKFLASLALLFLGNVLCAQDNTFKKPPKEIMDLVDIKPVPSPYITNDGKTIVFIENADRMTLEMLAEPELKLAGLRINPQNHNKARMNPSIGIYVQDVASGARKEVSGVPAGVKIAYASFSPKQNYFSFVNCTKERLELWYFSLTDLKAFRIEDKAVSATMAFPYEWSNDEAFLYFFERVNLNPFTDDKVLPTGPSIQESSGKKSTIRTYQDLLKNKNDENKFDFFATSRISKFSIKDKKSVALLENGVYTSLSVSPNGEYLLVDQLQKPYSYLLPYNFFPSKTSVFDINGKLVKEIVSKPLQDNIPQGFDACEEGIRNVQWRNDAKAELIYVIAQDKGDPKIEAQFRDEVYTWPVPFTEKANLIARTTNRFQSIQFGPNGIGIMTDGWWKSRNEKVYLLNAMEMLGQKVIFDYSTEDAYNLPGAFLSKMNANGDYLLMTDKKMTKLYLVGEGYAADGRKPFIDEFDLATLKTKRLWRADGISTFERISKIIDIEKGDVITRIEGKTQFPNYYKRNIRSKAKPVAITKFENPYKSIENITKKKIEYTREDGVKLFGTLYLPAGYDAKKDGRLPMLVHAYPTEFKDDKAAGQIKDSPHEFVMIGWGSPVFWVTRGYAVLDNAQFPIIGKGDEEPNDTYIPQLVANGKAAIKAVYDLGYCDSARVGVMGHSYGAFMTANLLAHSNLFAAGIARSGAYNRTLTPFGFQSEERTYWQAMDVYNKMAPFNYADKINEPLLLIHGDADNNPGTFTLQSERLFQAIKGLGGTSRLVLLPYESHGYAAKENIFHMLYEMDSWLEKYVKNKPKK